MNLEDVEVTTTSTANAGSVSLYVHVETEHERFLRLSAERADAAMAAGLRGDELLAEALAETADLWANRAVVLKELWDVSERMGSLNDRINDLEVSRG